MEEYQEKRLGKFRQREKYSLVPIIMVGDIFVWTGKWNMHIDIKEELIKTRYLEFDEYQCQHFYSNWKKNGYFRNY